MDRIRFINRKQTSIHTKRLNFWKRISIYRNLSWPRWGIKRDNDPKKYRVNKRSHKYLSVLPIILLSPAQVLANAVSQSNNGSVTNMAVQTLTGNMTTNQYGGNIVCQGPTLSISPFTTFGANYLKPYRDYYETPFYDPTDANDDGVPDNPGNVLFNQKNYSGTNKDSYALNFGISATFSIPLDRGFQNQCKSAADTQISIQKQVLENKRLDWQIARIRECGKLKQEGIMLTADSPFFNICKDVYLVPKANQVIPHTHKLK
jgi:hypothetical protein